jgi:hypothetical protein
MSVQVGADSRLLFGFLLSVDDIEFFDLLNLPEIQEQTDDTSYEWRSTDRIDLVAHRFYGSPALWWVLALANNIELVPTGLNEGARLRVPSPRYVNNVLLPEAKRLARDRR